MNADDNGLRPAQLADRLKSLGRRMTGKPLPSLLTAVAIGFLAGIVLRLFETPKREK